MTVLGWDIGGANLKASNGVDRSMELAFPLWKQPELLATALSEMAREFRTADIWAVTMTGELADCFLTKRDGVSQIVRAVQLAAGDRPVAIWTTTGELVDASTAIEWPLVTAASNWLALATWVGRMTPGGCSLLIDCGSTTTDIIPIVEGFPDPEGRTDLERLASGELVYSGWKRTPAFALADSVTLHGQSIPLAAELFATALDVHLILEAVDESEDCETANGRPANRDEAFIRLTRLVCADAEELSNAEAIDLARQLADRQVDAIAKALVRVNARLPQPCQSIVLSGSGEFLARHAVLKAACFSDELDVVSLTEVLGRPHATAACAFALARLAGERLVLDATGDGH